jgi:hypothetical protein
MRVGTNPLRNSATLPAYKRHRIIVPVHIPSRDGYYEHALEIFRISLASLLATVDPDHVAITVIDNASIPEVEALLTDALAAGRIDRHVRLAINRGKPDAVIAELRASYERFATIADCDVLFLHGWLAEVESVYRTWPAAGAVAPYVQPKLYAYEDASTWLHALVRGQLRLGKFASDEDMDQYARSIGQESLYSPVDHHHQYALKRKGRTVLLGCGHFVVTMRTSAFADFGYTPRLMGTGGGERDLDRQVDRCGLLRVSTTQAHVIHMGNTPEAWISDRLQSVLRQPATRLSADPDPMLDDAGGRRSLLPYPIRLALAWPLIQLAHVWRKLGSSANRDSR